LFIVLILLSVPVFICGFSRFLWNTDHGGASSRLPTTPHARIIQPQVETTTRSEVTRDDGFVVHGQQPSSKLSIYFVWIDPNRAADAEVFERAIARVDKGTSFLQVMFWKDDTQIPERLPMTEIQADAQVAQYERNRNTELEQFYLTSGDTRLEPSGRRPVETFRLIEESRARKPESEVAKHNAPAPPTANEAELSKPVAKNKYDAGGASLPTHKHEIRVWSDNSGSFSTRASFVSKTGQKVKLRREDGIELEVELSKLSESDIAYIRSLRR
jgi:hypothetical protein